MTSSALKCIICGSSINTTQLACSGCNAKIDNCYRNIMNLSRRAEEGDAKAQGEMALVYTWGKGLVKRDIMRSKLLFQSAFEKGEALGYYGCGLCCLDGLADTPIDYEKALSFARQAVELNSPYGMQLMGRIFREKDWAGHDDKEAIRWFRKAAESGDASSCVSLAIYYEIGDIVKQDLKEAEKLNTRAIEIDTRYYFHRALFYNRQKLSVKALLDWGNYHEHNLPLDSGHPEFTWGNTPFIPSPEATYSRGNVVQYDWFDVTYNHLTKELIPKIESANRRFLYYRLCRAITDYKIDQVLKSGYSHNRLFGKKGAGYFALTDQGVYIYLNKSLSKNYANVRQRLFSSYSKSRKMHWYDSEVSMTHIDILKYIPYNKIKSIIQDDDNEMVLLEADENIEIWPVLRSDVLFIYETISAIREGTVVYHNSSTIHNVGPNGFQQNGEFLEKLKMLKALFDAGILNEREYDEKKAIVLHEIGI